jgi:hypothetical protein
MGCVALGCVALSMFVYLDRARQSMLASTPPHRPLSALVLGPALHPLSPGGWAGATQVLLRVTLQGDATPRPMVPEIEILSTSRPFTAAPNAAGTLMIVPAHRRHIASVRIAGLKDGESYHWRVRVRGRDGSASAWIDGPSFRVSVDPPPAPKLLSANVAPGVVSNISTPALHWQRPHTLSGVAYYQWAISRDPHAPPTWHRTDSLALHLHGLPSGVWHIRVRAMDRAGNPSTPLRWTVHIDRSVPTIDALTASDTTLTPGGEIHLRFTLAKPAAVTLSAFRAGSLAAPAFDDLGSFTAGDQDVVWHGLDGAGRPLTSGTYRLVLEAHDTIGNATRASITGLGIDARRIVVSLSKQDLTVYDGARVLLHTLITSGGPETRTPLGTFHIIARYGPYVMRSPWPKSSPLWYPDSPVNFALLFREGGYFLHDAPWRSVYGPGSNAVDGIPGGNTTGTHGCVNVPYAAERWLYQWAQLGTTVEIFQ